MQKLVRDVPVARHVQDYAVRVLAGHAPRRAGRARARPSASCASAPRRAARRRVLLAAKIRALFEGRFAASHRRRAGRRAPRAPPPRAPQLRGRGRGREDRQVIEEILKALARDARRSTAAARWACSTSSRGCVAARRARPPPASRRRALRRRVPAQARLPRDREPARVRRAHARRAPHQEERAAASSSPITATTRPATTSATSTGTSTSASIGCSSASTKRKRTSPSTSSSTRRRRWRFGDGEKLRYAKRARARRSPTSASRTSIASPSSSTTDEISERMPTTRGKARIFKVFRFLRGARSRRAHRPRRRAEDLRRAAQAPRPRRAAHRSLRSARLRARHQRAPLQQVRAVRGPRRRPERGAARSSRGDVRVYDCETGDEREVTVTAKVLEQLSRRPTRSTSRRSSSFCTARQVPLHPRRRQRALRRARSSASSAAAGSSARTLVHFTGLPLRARSLAIGAAAGAVVVGALHPQAAAPPGGRCRSRKIWERILRDKEATSLFSQLKRLLSLLLQLALLALCCSRSAIRAAAANLIRGATSWCSSTPAHRCRRPTSRRAASTSRQGAR